MLTADPAVDLRLPPHSIEAEMCVLASVMLDADVREDVLGMLTDDSFYQPDHRILFAAVAAIHGRGHPVDGVILSEELKKRGQLEEVGGLPYLGAILNTVPTAAHGPHYAKIVRDKALARRQLSLLAGWTAALYADGDPDELASKMLERLASAHSRGGRVKAHHIGSVLHEVMDEMENRGVPMLKTGLRDLDEMTDGIGLGEYLVVGARPSVGKSMFGKSIGLRLVGQGRPGAIISIEENRRKVGRNLLAAEARVAHNRIRRADLDAAEMSRITGCLPRLASLPLYVVDEAYSLADIPATVSMRKREHDIQWVLIDYLQLIDAEGDDGSRTERLIARNSVVLKNMFKRLGIAGIVLSQLNRESEKEQRLPRMSDLRQSGQLEQDADQIWLLHREDYLHEGEDKYVPDHKLTVIVKKNRDGRTGEVPLLFDDEHQRIDDWPGVADPF